MVYGLWFMCVLCECLEVSVRPRTHVSCGLGCYLARYADLACGGTSVWVCERVNGGRGASTIEMTWHGEDFLITFSTVTNELHKPSL